MDDKAPVTRRELKEELGALKKELKNELKDEVTELIRDVETSLLTAFHGYGKGQALRMHVLEVGDAAVNQRLAALEERVLNLETRRGPSH